MAKMFYNAKEAAAKLGRSEEQLKDLVREGQLREFRDAGSTNYKVGDVDGLLAKSPAKPAPKPPPASAAASRSASGEIVLEPIEDSGIALSPSGSDVVSLEGVDAEDTAAGARVTKKAKEGSSIPSVGVNVFDDDDLDEHVDPLAQTAVSDVAGLGLDGASSGSGILDLTRESDDTSLGAELLDEIYTGGEEKTKEADEEEAAGERTRAGMDKAISAKEADDVAAEAQGAPVSRAAVTQVIEYAPDAVSNSLAAVLVVALVVLWVAGLGAAAMVRGVFPGILQTLYSNLLAFAGGSILAAGIAGGVTYVLGKRNK